ncbi:MAG TPA: DUF2231 domain-containing protein, partial [Frankiaceae bacterium]|nr:DUF2231 domain-containing protein [Frankiaceae bacterium]
MPLPDNVAGVPLHPLVTHVVVVFVPLAALAALLVAAWPAFRRRFGWLAVGVALVAAGSIPLATNSGEALEERLPGSALIARHALLAEGLLPWAAALLVAVTVAVVLERRHPVAARREGPGAATLPATRSSLVRPVAVLAGAAAVVAAVGSGVQVVRIG